MLDVFVTKPEPSAKPNSAMLGSPEADMVFGNDSKTIDSYLAESSPDPQERQLHGFQITVKEKIGKVVKRYDCLRCNFLALSFNDALEHVKVHEGDLS